LNSSSGSTPLEIAECGGKDAGFLGQRVGKSPAELLGEAKILRQRAAKHAEKIRNRIGYNRISDVPSIQAQAEAGRTRHLLREIENFEQQADICEELARRKGGGP